jgi:hypothetical protein
MRLLLLHDVSGDLLLLAAGLSTEFQLHTWLTNLLCLVYLSWLLAVCGAGP